MVTFKSLGLSSAAEKRSSNDVPDGLSDEGLIVSENVDELHRALSNRQIQMMAIGASIGTALFVSIGWGLMEGGPASLLIGYVLVFFW